jgi:MOSC domain-containing protein YiiM
MPSSNLPPAKLYSIQVALPKDYGFAGATDVHDEPWKTGFFKTPIEGPVFVGKINVVGDGQADLKNHGGVDKAVLAYSADHYAIWRSELNMPYIPTGAFGENLTVAGWSEESVCIGDVFRIGTVTFEVSQPRQPCWKLARRWRMHELIARVLQSGRTGWYLRVRQQGWIKPRLRAVLLERPNPDWTIARANEI